MTSTRLTGGEAIVQGLLAHGVDTVFGLPGAQVYGLFDAFKQAEPALRTIGSRHEQGVAYMAFGYARASGRPGVYAVVPGPGFLNSAAALLTAYGSTTPVLCLAGQINTQFLGRERAAPTSSAGRPGPQGRARLRGARSVRPIWRSSA